MSCCGVGGACRAVKQRVGGYGPPPRCRSVYESGHVASVPPRLIGRNSTTINRPRGVGTKNYSLSLLGGINTTTTFLLSQCQRLTTPAMRDPCDVSPLLEHLREAPRKTAYFNVKVYWNDDRHLGSRQIPSMTTQWSSLASPSATLITPRPHG